MLKCFRSLSNKRCRPRSACSCHSSLIWDDTVCPYTYADPGIFALFFLVLSLFYRSQMVNFKEIYHFSRFQKGPTFSRGVQFFPGGSNCFFPIETHITCDFPGGVRTPCPPSGSALAILTSSKMLTKICSRRITRIFCRRFMLIA